MGLSPLQILKRKSPSDLQALIGSLPDAVASEMSQMPWWFTARPEQLTPPGDWSIWLILAGRGWGKTRSCAEWLVDQVTTIPAAPDGSPTEWAIMGETFGDVRTVCVEGPSGIVRCLQRRGLVSGKDFTYNRARWRLEFETGQKIHMLNALDADAGRGLNLSGIWCDEIAKWRYPYETWTEGLAPALRIGQNPRAVVATTPKPNRLLVDWTTRVDGTVYVTRGSTFENADNLSETALNEFRRQYEGTRIGLQELYGELFVDVQGALWSGGLIDQHRVRHVPEDLVRIVVAIDPAVTSREESAETGIVVAGLGGDGDVYVLEDLSRRASPDGWARSAVQAYHEWKADRIIAEVNQGGDIVQTLIRTVDDTVPYASVRASRGKRSRAEPVSALYEQGKVHHVGIFPALEGQMTTYVPEGNMLCDRLDALVWAVTELALTRTEWIVA